MTHPLKGIIAAWTPTQYPGGAPPYVSVYLSEYHEVQISVRSAQRDDGSRGEYAVVVMSREEFALLLLRATHGLVLDNGAAFPPPKCPICGDNIVSCSVCDPD